MSQYLKISGGYYDRNTSELICAADTDPRYQRVLDWLGAGNVADVMPDRPTLTPAEVQLIATQAAQQEKAAAISGIDDGQLQAGMKFDRLCVALALVVRDEINILRAAIPHRIISITRSTTTATVTTDGAHGLAIGDAIAIMGADVQGYNLNTTVASVPSATTFTYTMANSGTTPATGSLFYTLGAVPQMAARTITQLVAAIKTKIAATAE
jgi:hypothetical protein